ncbi:hypothetical protein PV325_013575, partial [Microctonus aethiopoides]
TVGSRRTNADGCQTPSVPLVVENFFRSIFFLCVIIDFCCNFKMPYNLRVKLLREILSDTQLEESLFGGETSDSEDHVQNLSMIPKQKMKERSLKIAWMM